MKCVASMDTRDIVWPNHTRREKKDRYVMDEANISISVGLGVQDSDVG